MLPLLLLLILSSFLFYLKFSKRIPVLMYHRIANIEGDRNALSPEKFEQQLRYLKSTGYTTIDMNQLYDYYANGIALPSKSVALTFDDGYADNLHIALPLLKKYGFIANVFVISDWIGKENKWENFGKALTKTMTERELQQWQQANNYIGSHTQSHPKLSSLSYNEIYNELSISKKTLDAITNTNIICICYPYGDFNQNVLKAAKECDYKIGLAIFNNAPIWSIDLLALPRIVIPSGQKMWEYKLKVGKWHCIFIILRTIERHFKTLFR